MATPNGKMIISHLAIHFFFVGIDCNQSTMDVKEKKKIDFDHFCIIFFLFKRTNKILWEKNIEYRIHKKRISPIFVITKWREKKGKFEIDSPKWINFIDQVFVKFLFFSFLKRMLKNNKSKMMELDSLLLFPLLPFSLFFTMMMMMFFQTWIEYASTEFHNKNWTYILWPFAKTKKKFFTENDAALLF